METDNRIIGDNNLQNNVDVVNNNSVGRDINLQNNINSVNNRVDNVEHRVSALEKTQYVVKTEVKFIREKHLEVGVYGEYNVGRSNCSEIGVNIVIPIGNSYLDRENKKINTRLDRLEQKVGGATIIERTIDKKGVVRSISISQGQLAVSGEF
jgi:tetrahydromethanopterin S-methyltransferase subunit G